MWDGEWNAGPGKHSSTTAIWKDLIGESNLSVTSGNINSAWNDISFIINNGSNLATCDYLGLNENIATIEISWQYSSSGQWNVFSFPIFSSNVDQPGF